MYDILPFPNITATTTEEQVSQINNYLIQFKETLEFILTNISTDNLSPELQSRIATLGEEIQTAKTEREDQIQQVAQKGTSVSDVINSQLFKNETIKGVKLNGVDLARDSDRKVNIEFNVTDVIEMNVNFNTGELEYEFK